MYITGTVWNRHKYMPMPGTIQKPVDFLPEEDATPGPECRGTTREKNRGDMLYTVQSGSYDLYRDSVYLHKIF